MLNLRAFIVVLVLALVTFHLARPICLRFMQAIDFDRRRNVWFYVTALVFLCPSFWLFVALVLPVLWWAGRRDPNPAALYLLLMYAMPPIEVQLPTVGIGQLFGLSLQRLLAFTVLLPAAFASRLRPATHGAPVLDAQYGALLAYVALLTALFMPVETFTTTLRRSFLLLLDLVLLYHVLRTTTGTRARIAEALVMYGAACAVMAVVGVFETLRGWLLYQGVTTSWSVVTVAFTYLMRGNLLRAQASAGHALTLGYILVIGFGVFLYALQKVPSKPTRWIALAWIWAGLVAALSRAPWMAAVLIAVLYTALHPRGVRGMVKVLAVMVGAGAILASTTLGKDLISYLPFVGTVDSGNIDYRQALWNTSLELIKQNPFFGSPSVLSHMEHLRQGQGIIDLMNGYLAIALYYGLVGLALFLAVFAIALVRGYRVWALAKKSGDRELCLLGACLLSTIIGTLFFAATAAFDPVAYVLLALLGAYGTLKPAPARPAAATAPARGRPHPPGARPARAGGMPG